MNLRNFFLFAVCFPWMASAQQTLQDTSIRKNQPVMEWTPTGKLAVPVSLAPVIAYHGYVYAVGGSLGTDYTNTVQYAPIRIDGSLGAWKTTSNLPSANSNAGLAASNNYLYMVGGKTGFPTNQVLYAQINVDGSLGPWVATTPLLSRYNFGQHATFIENGYLYTIGGWSSGSMEIAGSYAKINTDGSIGSWSSLTLYDSAESYYPPCIADQGFIYKLGGKSGDNPSRVNRRAQIAPNGNADSWTRIMPLPSNLSYQLNLAFSDNGYAYLSPSGVGPGFSQIYSSRFDDSLQLWESGTIQNANALAPFPGVVIYQDVIYAIGGQQNNTAVDSVAYTYLHRPEPLHDPIILSFNPSEQKIGSTITIQGNYFSASGDNQVLFSGNIAQSPISSTASSITVSIPEGTLSGPITVMSGGFLSLPSKNSLEIVDNPNIQSFAPSAQYIGDTIIIYGKFFRSVASENTVHFTGNVNAIPFSGNDTSLMVRIPEEVFSGPITVRNRYGESQESIPLAILGAPSIISFSPSSLAIGETLVITGTNFSNIPANNTVYFTGGVHALAIVSTKTSISVVLPSGVRTGQIAVKTRDLYSAISDSSVKIIRPAVPCPNYDIGPGCTYKTLQEAVNTVQKDGGRPYSFRVAPGFYPKVSIRNLGAVSITFIGAVDSTGQAASIIDVAGPLDFDGRKNLAYQKRPVHIENTAIVKFSNFILQNGAPAERTPEGYYDARGGAILLEIRSKLYLDNCIIRNNYSYTATVAFVAAGSTLTMNACVISNNVGYGDYHQGIEVSSNNDRLKLSNVTFSNNEFTTDIWDFGNNGRICLDHVTTQNGISGSNIYAKNSTINSCDRYGRIYNCGGNSGRCFSDSNVSCPLNDCWSTE